MLEHARHLGTSKQALLEAYPSLRAEDLANAWAYVRSHPVKKRRRFEVTKPPNGSILFE